MTNALDDDYQSAFAIAGVAINGVPLAPVGPEQSATLLYINGMSTTFDVARDSQLSDYQELENLRSTQRNALNFDGGDVLLRLGDRGFLSDLLGAARQAGHD